MRYLTSYRATVHGPVQHSQPRAADRFRIWSELPSRAHRRITTRVVSDSESANRQALATKATNAILPAVTEPQCVFSCKSMIHENLSVVEVHAIPLPLRTHVIQSLAALIVSYALHPVLNSQYS